MTMRNHLAASRMALIARIPADTYPTPTIASVTPDASTTGGDTLAVVGTGFLAPWGAASVEQFHLGATAVASFVVQDAEHATIVTPATAPGAVPLIVKSAGGGAVLPSAVTFVAPDFLLTEDGNTLATEGGTELRING